MARAHQPNSGSETARGAACFCPPPNFDGLFDADATNLQRVVAVRRELYRSLPTGEGRAIAALPLGASYAELVHLMSGGDQGLWCSGAALVFQRALEALGFRAWILHYGFSGEFSYALNVVEVDGRRVLQDCFLNEGCELDLVAVLEDLARGSPVEFAAELRDSKPYLAPEGDEREADALIQGGAAKLESIEGFARFSVPAQMHRDRAMREYADLASAKLRSLNMTEDHRLCLQNPIAVFDGTNLHTGLREMPLVAEWLARDGRALAWRGEDPAASQTEEGASAKEHAPVFTEQEVSARVARERREGLERQLNLESRLDHASYDAKLWWMRHEEQLARAERAEAALAEQRDLHEAARSEWLNERLNSEASLDQSYFEAKLLRVRHDEDARRIARVEAELAGLKAGGRATQLALEEQLAKQRTESERRIAQVRDQEKLALQALARLQGVLAGSRYLRMRRWLLRTFGRADDLL